MDDAPDSPADVPTSSRPQLRPVQRSLDADEAEHVFAASMSASMNGSFLQCVGLADVVDAPGCASPFTPLSRGAERAMRPVSG